MDVGRTREEFGVNHSRREFVHNKCKTLFIISWPFWINIEYSHRVPTLIFVEIIVWELIDTSQWRNVKISWYAHDNFLHNKAKIIIEITSAISKQNLRLGEFFRGNSRTI